MSRAQLALNVDDLDEAIAFYSTLFNTSPAKVKQGYANFAVAEPPLKLVLIENPGHGGTLNHLGVEVEVQRRGACGDHPADRRGHVHRRTDRHHLLLRHPGQGVGHRTRRARSGRSTPSSRVRTRRDRGDWFISMLLTTTRIHPVPSARLYCEANGLLDVVVERALTGRRGSTGQCGLIP